MSKAGLEEGGTEGCLFQFCVSIECHWGAGAGKDFFKESLKSKLSKQSRSVEDYSGDLYTRGPVFK